ncbi:hypothetical protein [uncultured Parabacteroides sp.]|jgi:hypothetical protein|uniref:hypothetical protein n=1 Tax=uncultured Parabacteroides sp. TaxID=512312 RepID=UPI0025F441E2|nr:hypothetical protein [uncultured Parabacteroides sp.]
MEKQEKTLLCQINEIYSDLKDESSKNRPNYSKYSMTLNKFLNLILELYDMYKPDYLDKLDIQHLRLTIYAKEGIKVETAYNKVVKKETNSNYQNLAKAMAKATYQINLDVYSVLNKANEIKDEVKLD